MGQLLGTQGWKLGDGGDCHSYHAVFYILIAAFGMLCLKSAA